MTKIEKLPSQVISQIAAGEIVDNPASVCKELVENSIDANATQISIQLGEQLTNFIRITDNGVGISRDQVGIAFERHATSKLRTIKDLDDLLTLGFRGEALASISNVSEIELISKTSEETIGSRSIIKEGKLIQQENIGAPKGTSIIVKDLFYNTPVRKKYLKSTRKELEFIIDLLEKISLSHPEISIQVQYMNRMLLHSKPSSKPLDHIYTILGRDISENLLPISFETESYKIKGYISNQKLFRSTGNREYLFVNGRTVRNAEIEKAIRKTYHTMIPLNSYPVYLLYIDIDPSLIDINIHPKKQELRLSNENHLVTILPKVVQSVLNPNLEVQKIEEEQSTEKIEPTTIFDLAEEKQKSTDTSGESVSGKVESSSLYEGKISHSINPVAETVTVYQNENIQKSRKEETNASFPIDLNRIHFSGILFKTYILFENRGEEIFYLLDQHAAHERILFEKFYREMEKQEIIQQILIEPILLHLSSSEKIILVNHLKEFHQLGFIIEPFGEKDFILREVPHTILINNYEQFIHEVLSEIDEHQSIAEKHIYKIMRMGCRAAVKAGDQLSESEALSLLASLLETIHPFTCPHGRPTIIKMTKRRLEKLFLREM